MNVTYHLRDGRWFTANNHHTANIGATVQVAADHTDIPIGLTGPDGHTEFSATEIARIEIDF